MAIVVKDRVKQNANAPGTGTITLSTTPTGFQAFSAIGNGNITYFAVVDPVSGDWEVTYGTYTLSGTTLSRNATPLSSSAAGALVNFTGAVEVFCTYPSEKAIYEETSGEVLFDGGPITIIGTGVTSYTSFTNFFAEMFGNANTYVQTYIQNQNSGSDASADYVALNDIGTDSTYYVDMGMNSSGYSSGAFQIYTPNSGYVYSIGGGTSSKMFVGSADDDLILHAGGFATTNIGLTISGADQTVAIAKDATVGGTFSATGAADFGSTVLLSANPSLALQAATKQYVDNQVTAGIHIHEPVRVETTANLTASYTQGGTTFNITDITGNKTLTTSVTHGLSLNDQIWLYSTAGNGLSINTAYFVYSIPAVNQITVSLTFGGAEVTGLTNATGLTYNTRANSGVGAKLTNAGTQAALVLDTITLASTNRVMVRLQTNPEQNGVYTVTNTGSISTNWELTRATDSNKVNPADPNGVGTGDYYFTREGSTNAGDSHVLTTEPNTMIIGYTGLTYTQFSGSVVYTGVAPINVTGQQISLTGTVAATNGGTGTSTVTTGDLLYGSATNTWSKLPLGAAHRSLVVNAGGTQVEWNAVALNQANAVSGTLDETNGGTGLNTYTLGDTLYASAANTLSKAPGNITTTKKFLAQTGTGAASAAPVWDTVAGSDVVGNITGQAGSVANALTAGTYLTSGGTYNGSVARTFTVDATSANTASKVVARDVSGNFSAGTITAALSGNATTATTATNVAGGAANQLLYQSAASTTAFATAPTVSGTYLNWNGSALAWTAIATPNAVTFNNGGAGGISGSTFNGSAALTVSYNTVGAPSTTGTNASGSWGISITGSAASATTATTATTATNLAGGLAGTIPYQSAAGTTAMLAAGTANFVLKANGAAAPSWTAGTISGIQLGSNLATLTFGTYLTGTSYNGSAAVTLATNATNANTASTIVARDASGNFSAGTITATLTGNATNVSGTVAVANGGTGATTAAAARTNLGATTVGGNVFTLVNPSAITFPRFNADNTVSALDAATFRTAIGAGTSSTTGTVTSVATAGTVSGITLTGGPITSTGTVTLGGTLAVTPSNFASQTANTFLAAPTGVAGVPTFRAVVAADIPTLNQNTTGTAANVTGVVAAVNGGTGQSSYAVGDLLYASTTTALSKLADVATGNALISGGVGVAPSYGKIGLTTHISGVLPVANGGTNASTAGIAAFNNITGYTATGATGTTSTNLVFSTSPTLITPALGTPSALVGTNITGTATAFNINGTVGATTPATGSFTSLTASGDLLRGLTTAVPTVTRTGVATTPQFQTGGNAQAAASYGLFNFSLAASAAYIAFAKSRSGTVGTQTVLVLNDDLGNFNFAGSDGTSFVSSASITAAVDGTPATGSMPGRLTFFTAAAGVAPAERVRITSAGFVGVNQTTPGSTLDVKGTLRLSGATSGYVGLAPAAAAGSTTYTLPVADGTAGQVLSTNGTATLSWATGASSVSITNDVATATDIYPLLASATTGTLTASKTSNAKLLYTPSTGEFKSEVVNALGGIYVNSATIDTNYTIAAGNNAGSFGPITVATGITVTVSSGSVWTVT